MKRTQLIRSLTAKRVDVDALLRMALLAADAMPGAVPTKGGRQQPATGRQPAHTTSPKPEERAPDAWEVKGVKFPNGTYFRAWHKGKSWDAVVTDGALFMEGKRYTSPSEAAKIVTGRNQNGWAIWECRLPGAKFWQRISEVKNGHAH